MVSENGSPTKHLQRAKVNLLDKIEALRCAPCLVGKMGDSLGF